MLILLVATGCSEKAENLEEDQVSEYFSDIYFMPDSKIYVNEWGDPVDGKYETEGSEAAVQIRMEFEEGKIIEGVWALEDGSETKVYEQRDGFLVQNYYHENGQKSVEFIMDAEMEIVASNSWYIDGRRSIASNRDSALTWHKNGQLASKVYMKEGKMEGEGKGWHENGELASISHYKEDEWHGIFKKWDENGNLVEEKTYNMGMPEGIHKYWDEHGNLIEERAFEDGKPISLNRGN